MTNIDAFDRDLAAALQAYAGDVPVAVDPARIAGAAVSRAATGRPWAIRNAAPDRAVARWLVAGALLTALAVAGATLWAGWPVRVVEESPIPTATQTSQETPHPSTTAAVRMPAELSGGFAQRPSDVVDPPTVESFIDFEGALLVVDPLGVGNARFGRAISYEQIDENSGVLTIEGPEPCGLARYRVDRFSSLETSIRLTRLDDPCDDRAELLELDLWRPMSTPYGYEVELFPGKRYPAVAFGEAFTFAARHLDPVQGRSYYDSYLRHADEFEIHAHTTPGGWSVRFVDDRDVWANPCTDSGGILEDIPATPDRVAAWLEGFPNFVAAPPTELIVDGRTALRLDLRLEPSCGWRQPPLLSGDTWRERPMLRVYGIPTGDDTILAIVSSDAASQAAVLANVDGLIESIRFE